MSSRSSVTFSRPRRGSRAALPIAALERLEDRTLLTAYVVDTLADTVAADGHVSLREAILAANTDAAVNEAAAGEAGATDAISFASPLNGGTITLAGAELAITGDLAILGRFTSGRAVIGQMSVSGGGLSRVFRVAAGATASIEALNVLDGGGVNGGGIYRVEEGGAVYNAGALTLRDCLFQRNVARYGGAVMNAVGATLDAGFSVFAEGSADLASAVFNNAGGTLAVTSCSLTANKSGPGAPGGAFALYNAGTARLSDSGISLSDGGLRNDGTMTYSVGSVQGCTGGSVANFGDLALTGVVVAANSRGVLNRGALRVVGGYVSVNGTTGVENYGRADVWGCTIYGNASPLVEFGGGVLNASGATLSLAQSVVVMNVAGSGGGVHSRGTLSVTDCLIRDNGASGYPGYYRSENPFLSRETGGGIDNWGTAIVAGSVVYGNATAGSGGGVANAVGAELTLAGCTVSSNRAAQAGGGVWVNGSTPEAGGRAVISRSAVVGNSVTDGTGGGIKSRATLEVYNSTVSDNSAFAIGGGIQLWAGVAAFYNSTIAFNHTGQGGGGIAVGGGTRTRLVNTIVAGNGPDVSRGRLDDISFSVVSGTNNLVGDRQSSVGLMNGVNGNIVGVDWRAVLDPVLRYNGGPTPTHALIPGSPAIDAGTSSPFPTDQRGPGFPRLVGAAVDVGAFEFQPTAVAAAGGGALAARAEDEPLAAFWAQADEDETLERGLLAG